MPQYELEARLILTIQTDDGSEVTDEQKQEALLKTEQAVNVAAWSSINNGMAAIRAHFHNVLTPKED